MKTDKFDYFPDDLPLPNKIIKSNEEFAIGGVDFVANEIGAGEAEAMTLFYLPTENILFSSDVISGAKMTAFLVEGRSETWLEQLDKVSSTYKRVKTAYPGHGQSGSFEELSKAQKNYIIAFRQLIAKQLKKGDVTPQSKQIIVAEMERRYPNYLPVAFAPKTIETNRQLLERNIDAVAKEIRQSER